MFRGRGRRGRSDLRWIDAESEARKPPPRPLVDARREAWRMRLALVAAGTVYIVAAAAVVWYGQRAAGFDARAAWFLAYSSSLTGVFLHRRVHGSRLERLGGGRRGMVRRRVRAARLAIAPDTVGGHSRHRERYGVCPLPLIVVAPLALRITRPLAVGFVPLVGLYVVCAAAEAFVLELFGISFAGRYTPEISSVAAWPPWPE